MPRYVQWTIPSLLYKTRRKDPLLYTKGETGHLFVYWVILHVFFVVC